VADAKKVIEVVVKGKNDLSGVIKTVNKDLASLTKVAQGIGTGMAVVGTAIVTAMGAAAVSTARFGEELVTLRGRTGLSAESLSELKFIAEQNESSLNATAIGFKFLAKNAYESSVSLDKTADAFKLIGVDVKGADGNIRPLKELFLDVSSGLRNVDNDAKRTALTLQIFGKGGAEMANILKLTREEFEDLAAEARRLGLVMDDDAADAADAFGDNLDATRAAMDSLVRTIGTAALPVLNEWVTKIQEVVVDTNNWAKAAPEWETATLKWAAAIAAIGIALSGIITIGTPVVAAIGAIIAAFTAPAWAAIAVAIGIIGAGIYGVVGFLNNMKKETDEVGQSLKYIDSAGIDMVAAALAETAKNAPPAKKAVVDFAKEISDIEAKIAALGQPGKLKALQDEFKLLQIAAENAKKPITDTILNVLGPDGSRPGGGIKGLRIPGETDRQRFLREKREGQRAELDNPSLDAITLVDPWEESEEGLNNFVQIGVNAVGSIGTALGSALSSAITGAQQQFESFGDFLRAMFAEIVSSFATALAQLGLGSLLNLIPGGALISKFLPKFETGGFVPKTGPAIVHAGEYVLTKSQVDSARGSFGGMSPAFAGGGSGRGDIHVHMSVGMYAGSQAEALEAGRKLGKIIRQAETGRRD